MEDEYATSRIARLEKKLWGGFSERAVEELQAVRDSRVLPNDARARAAWALARWDYVNGRFRDAYNHAVFMRSVDTSKCRHKPGALLEIELLLRFGRVDEALGIVKERRLKNPSDPDFILAHANVVLELAVHLHLQAEGEWFGIVNELYQRHNIRPLRKAEEDAPLSFFNLSAEPASLGASRESKVSVIIPAFNAADTISVAIESLLGQSWKNLEILVVDDCSGDDTSQVVSRYCSADSRVKLLSHDFNKGAYAARNTGLRAATGDYITTHDSDDWSHPQKIELQARMLDEEHSTAATVTYWSRADRRMCFLGTSRPSGKFLQWNHSSLMFRRSVLDAVGEWDQVRVGGDTEMVWRVQRIFGEDAIKELYPDVPLSFALADVTSLTRSAETHSRTIEYGLRREYRESADYWHRMCSDPLQLKLIDGKRAFPSPARNLPGGVSCLEFDLLVVSDFNISGGAYVSTMNYIHAARAKGMRVAVFHWRRYDLDVSRPLNDELRGLAHEGEIHIVCPGEEIKARYVIVGYPPVLNAMIDNPPHVEHEKLFVIVNQVPARLSTGLDIQYDPMKCRQHLRRVFGEEGVWAPISGRVRELMNIDGRFPRVTSMDWTPMIDVEAWLKASESKGLPDQRRRPILGRHGRDHYTKWPSKPADLAAAYCANSNIDVRLLGGAAHAIDTLGEKPKNWTVYAFGSRDVRDFLLGLDFFVHYAHEEYIEEFGRSVIEAMACRVPVILPPVFESTFGDAALYANARDVLDLIEGLWGNPALYQERVELGVQFVSRCDYQTIDARLMSDS